jgi:predicted dehydrogenase
MSVSSSSRRDFLGRSTAAVIGGVAPLMGKPASRVLGANDRIRLGVIGVGGNGTGMMRLFHGQSEERNDVQVVALCDVYSRYRERARRISGLEEKNVYLDYRELLARNDVDGVSISTPDHWHALMALDAMAAGKDVYLQKPMTLTIKEAKKVAEAAAQQKRILQVGSQYLSDPRHHKARELIAGGEIGKLLWAQGTYSRNTKVGEWNYYVDEEASHETIDWRRWLGPAPRRPFSPERFFRWRKYWDYSGGIATDLFYHMLGPLMYAMGAEFPTRVTGSGGIYVQKDREVPDTYATVIEYPDFFINLSSSMANAAPRKYFPEVIYGHKGTMVFERNKISVVPEPIFAPSNEDGSPKGAKVIEFEPFNTVRLHTDNFLSSMRSRKQPNLDPLLGYQIMAAIKLGVDSYLEGKVKCFDSASQRLVKRGARRPAYEGKGDNPPGSGYKKRV